MSKIFTRTFRVRWGELDANGTVSPANYLRYLIETAWDWGVAAGWDSGYSQNPDVFWVIRETEIRFLHPLRHNDIFEFTIWMVNWQRVRGTRCFELKFKDSDQVIAQGTQQVVYMDTKTGRPISLPEEEVGRFRLEHPRVFPFERFPKIARIENPFTRQRQVELVDLDTYEHVNNATYVNYAEEVIAQRFVLNGWSSEKLAGVNVAMAIRRIHIQYLSIASWNETLNISTHSLETQDTHGSEYVSITHLDGTPVAECILDWELIDRKRGDPVTAR